MGWRPRLLCCLFLSLSLSLSLAAAAMVYQEWEISYQFKSPDCVRKLAATINGQTPEPTIRATQGDTVVVRVKNSLLTENVAIHWHGIRQMGTPWADGTEGVTQCPILPGDTFTYTFVVDRPGTYMYHAHYGMQRSAGLNGLIVVAAAPRGPDAEPFRYDGEHDVLLNDWWHKSTYEQATGLASVPFGWVGEPQSLLINGRGRFNCSAVAVPAGTCNATHPECAAPVFAVVPGKTYRFRIASVTSLSALNFEIEDRDARLIGYPAPAVASSATSSRRPSMGHQQYAAALVVMMLFATLNLATGRPVADQNPATAGGTIARSAPATSASGSLPPAGGGRTPPPSPTSSSSPSTSSGDPAGTGSNPSGTLSTPPSEGPAVGTGEEPSSPHRSPPSVGAPDEGQPSTFLLGFLTVGLVITVGILNVGFERILGGWSRGEKLVYKVSTWLATVFLGLAVVFIAAWYRASSMTRNRILLSISEICAKLGVILSINLLVVIMPCRLGRGECMAAITSVGVITFTIATATIWWGRIIIRIIGPRRQTQTQTHTQLAGVDMV